MDLVYYCSVALSRNTDLRQKPEWLNGELARDDGLVVPVWNSKNLVRFRNAIPKAIYLPIRKAALILGNATEVVYLGHDDDRPVFAADISGVEKDRAIELIEMASPGSMLVDLRRVGTLLGPNQASTLAFARGMAFWHQRHPYCARCGGRTSSKRGGHMRYCTTCDSEIFPRIDPAVIMLVEQLEPDDGVPRCLLGRHNKLPGSMYSTLAGFVDPLENLEQAVIREVKEEAGLTIEWPHYIASQPWPFPASMMFGFRATTRERRIVIDQNELQHAAWFTADELDQFGEVGDDDAGYILPPKDSIARTLIELWRDESSPRRTASGT